MSVSIKAKAQRAVVLLPGLGNNSKDYKAVEEALESRGLHVQVLSGLTCKECATRIELLDKGLVSGLSALVNNVAIPGCLPYEIRHADQKAA